MAKRKLVDDVHSIVIALAPTKVTKVRREKAEGMSRHARVKAVHREHGVMLRILEPGQCEELYIVSTSVLEVIWEVEKFLSSQNVPLQRVGC